LWQWTQGFWAERFKACRDSMIPHLWDVYTDPKQGHATQNFASAADWIPRRMLAALQDGDFYKLMEAMTAVYAINHDPKLGAELDTTSL